MGGPMNMSPSVLQWFLLVVFIDVVLLFIATVATRLLDLSHKVTGGLLLLTGLSVLALGVSNQMNSPHVDDINKGSLMPVAPELNILVYLISGVCVIAGVVTLFRHFRRS
jgi:hypothetical protein